VLELGGIRDVLAKSLGTTNPINMLKAAEVALRDLRRPEEVAAARGKAVRDVLPLPTPKHEAEEAVASVEGGEVTAAEEAEEAAGLVEPVEEASEAEAANEETDDDPA
jgi:small subunit ribosomal protein S5